MIDLRDFVELIVRPICEGFQSIGNFPKEPCDNAVKLLTVTAMTESDLTHMTQHNDGLALGFFQIEPSTHDWLKKKIKEDKVKSWLCLNLCRVDMTDHAPDHLLIYNLRYAAFIARQRYLVIPDAIPDANDNLALAAYWKDHYNTSLGDGKIKHFKDKAFLYDEEFDI